MVLRKMKWMLEEVNSLLFQQITDTLCNNKYSSVNNYNTIQATLNLKSQQHQRQILKHDGYNI